MSHRSSLVGDSVPSMPRTRALTFIALALLGACTSHQDQLERAELHYRAARYEYALTNLEDLEPELGRLDASERVRYHFVRGMTHARLQQREHARHWLALTREISEGGSTLSSDAQASMRRILADTENAPTPVAQDAGATPTR